MNDHYLESCFKGKADQLEKIKVFQIFWVVYSDLAFFQNYLKERNFRGKKISRVSRIFGKFSKINFFFDPPKISIHEN